MIPVVAAILVTGFCQVGAEEVLPDDVDLVAIRAALLAERDRIGTTPTAEAFGPALRAAGVGTTENPLDSELLLAAWLEFRAMQRPPVSPEQVAEFARRRRDGLKQVRIRYRTERKGRNLT